MGNINRKIAHEANLSVVAIALQLLPLCKKDKLQEFLFGNLFRKCRSSPFQGCGLTRGELSIPSWPSHASEFVFEGAKQGIVGKPGMLGLSKRFQPALGGL